MKKHVIAVALLGLAFAACKKDHTCDCTVTTDGVTTTRTQITGLSLDSIPLGVISIPLPSLLPARDTTTQQPLHNVNTRKTTYSKVSMSDMRAACYASSVETLNDFSVNQAPGIYTVTTTQSGTKTYDCKIE